MLEPAVRPVGSGLPNTAATGNVPFEQQSFGALLSGAQSGADGGAAATEAPTENGLSQAAAKPDPLNALAAPGCIENKSLRNLIAQHQPPANAARSAEPTTE